MAVSNINSVLFTGVSAINGITRSTLSAVGGQTITAAASTSYANLGGTGNRVGVVGIQASAGLMILPDGITDLINGSFANTNYFSGTALSSSIWLLFDFGTPVLIDEAKWYQDNATGNGTWQWEGSNDNSSFTNIGSSFTLGGATTQTITALNGNATSYRFYRLLGVSGSTSTGPYTQEIEFKISGMTDPVSGTSYANAGGSGDRTGSITMTNSGIIVGTPPYNAWIDGSTTETIDAFSGGGLSGSVYVKWDFGSSKTIKQAKYYQQNADSQGVWQWQGSADDSAWTSIGNPFILGLSALQYDTATGNNATAYRYYRILGVSGSTSAVPYVHQFEFSIA